MTGAGVRDDYEEALAALFAKRPSLIKSGLERMTKAFRHLGLGETLPPCVLIAGTNGKGSTAGMLWHLLASLGYRVGLFTSPHLCHFRERIQCSHAVVSDAMIMTNLTALEQALGAELYAELSFFEVTTLLAFLLFQQNGCELLVLEVGLGGRWDATNVTDPLASAVVSIDYDHQAWLGDTLQAIAGEKLGVARAGRPLFWGERRAKPGLAEALAAAQARTGFELARVGEAFFYDAASHQVALKIAGLPAVSLSPPAWLASAPPALRHNFALSLALFYWLLHHPHALPASAASPLERAHLACARFASPEVAWPYSLLGRFQSLLVKKKVNKTPAKTPQKNLAPKASTEPTPQDDRACEDLRFVVDVCHNRASAEELIDSLHQSGILGSHRQRVPALVSILADKDVNGILDLLRPVAAPLYLFAVGSDRSLATKDLAPRHSDLPVFADFAKAWDYAYKDRSASVGPWLVCGSFLAVGEVINHFSAFPAQQQFRSVLTGHWPAEPTRLP